MAVANPTAAGESNEVDLSAKLATREVASMKNTSHLVLVELDVLGAVSVWGFLRLRVDDGRMR